MLRWKMRYFTIELNAIAETLLLEFRCVGPKMKGGRMTVRVRIWSSFFCWFDAAHSVLVLMLYPTQLNPAQIIPNLSTSSYCLSHLHLRLEHLTVIYTRNKSARWSGLIALLMTPAGLSTMLCKRRPWNATTSRRSIQAIAS